MNLDDVVGLFNYWIVIFLMMTGFYIVIARQNLVKSIIGLNIFQTSVFLLYITMGKVDGGTAPIIPPRLVTENGEDDHDAAGQVADQAADLTLQAADQTISHGTEVALQADQIIYSNPLPSVLMLTAIVVGISTTALALALIVRVREDYGTVEEDKILELDRDS
jgi:multicomponent Na+:H+ antiporter subunit C